MQFGSKQSSPSLKDGTIRSGRFDGFDDGAALRNNGNSSMTASPVPASRAVRPNHGVVQPTLQVHEVNPYFSPAMAMSPVGASPSESPLRGLNASGTSSSMQRSRTAIRPASPVDTVSSYHQLAGTSPNEITYQFNQDRFPFSGTDAHSASTAIRG